VIYVKINRILFIFIIIGCILGAVYITRPLANSMSAAGNTTMPGVNLTVTISQGDLSDSNSGDITISIGRYNARLPVFIDNILYGNVTKERPLNLKLREGNHSVKLCSGTICETIDVQIESSLKTTIDFEGSLSRDIPQGLLNVTIGNFNANAPVFIDNSNAGSVSTGKPLSLMINGGPHQVTIYVNNDSFTENINIDPAYPKTVNFEDRLNSEVMTTSLIVSIGGYNPQSPVSVFVDNKSVGNISQGKLLNVKVYPLGTHEAKVCIGDSVCEKEQFVSTFGKPNYLDFGDRLKQDAEFTEPTVRIIDHYLNYNTLVVEVEGINPKKTPITLIANISSVYTYVNYNHVRVSTSSTGQFIKYLRPGEHSSQLVYIYTYGGTDVIASEPVVLDVSSE
jgi:hypothetical protein